jgi:hypothetical protein
MAEDHIAPGNLVPPWEACPLILRISVCYTSLREERIYIILSKKRWQ